MNQPVLPPKQATEADRRIGRRIEALRRAKGVSQTVLGSAVGVTFQQVQKYERGQNRIGAGRLREIARVLDVPVSALYGEEGEAGGEASALFDLLRLSGAADVLRAYAAIEDDQLRREMLAVLRSAARISAREAPADGL